MGIYVEMIEKANDMITSEVDKDTRTNHAEFDQYIAAKIAKVETELRKQGIAYDPTQLWGKYIDLRGDV